MDDENTSNPSAGTWKPQLHVAWDVIFDRLLSPSGSEHAPQGSFSEFFRVVVDGKRIYCLATIPPHIWNRDLVFLFLFIREKILGVSSIQKSSGAGRSYRAPHALYQKSHAVLDQSSFEQGSLSTQHLTRCGTLCGSLARLRGR